MHYRKAWSIITCMEAPTTPAQFRQIGNAIPVRMALAAARVALGADVVGKE